MAWTIEIDDKVRRDLAKLGRPEAQRILRFLNDRLATAQDPRSIGEALHGDKIGDF